MKPIEVTQVQAMLNTLANQDVYIHLETTNGAYAAHFGEATTPVGAYIRNAQVVYTRGTIVGTGPYRVGLKMAMGWVYAEGLTDWEVDEQERLLLAGHDQQGRLAVALELSRTPFSM